MLRALLSARVISSLAAAMLAASALAQGSAPVPTPAPSPTPRTSATPAPTPAPTPTPTPTPSARPGPAPTPAPSPSPTTTPSPAPTPTPAPAAGAREAEQPPAALAGNWDLRIDGTTIFRFIIERTASGAWQGRWQRPDSFNSNGNAFANLRGGVKSTASMTGIAVGPMVELAFDDPRPGAVPDIFRFRLIAPDAVAMGYVGTQLPPYLLVRAGADDPLGNWDSAKVYRRQVPGARPATGAAAPSPSTPDQARSDPATPGPAAPAAPARAATPPPVIQPMPDGRIILGPQVRFLDLTPREGGEEEGEAAAADEPVDTSEVDTSENAAPAAAGPPQAPPAAPAAASPASSPAPAPAPARPTPEPPPAPATGQPAVGEDFLEGL